MYGMTMLRMISTAPITAVKLRCSLRNTQPMIPAQRGLSAQYIPVVAASVYFWARGCSAKPKLLHMTARNRVMSHSFPEEGSDGDSNIPPTYGPNS